MFRNWQPVMAWTLFIAALMISSLPTYSWSSIRIRRDWRLFALAGVALFGAALIVAPWPTLLVLAALYLLMIPFALASYARLKRRRAGAISRGRVAQGASARSPEPGKPRADAPARP